MLITQNNPQHPLQIHCSRGVISPINHLYNLLATLLSPSQREIRKRKRKMITVGDFYKVMCAMVPLYFAMLVAYSSVKWWKIFTAEQCAGINRFVAVFAVPVLSFHFISQNNPFQMDTKFILADTISKVFVLLLLSLWAVFCSGRGGGRLDWVITLFSLATLPNTLVMGIPLLNAMYGDFTQSLMVQLVVLQCIIWYIIFIFSLF